MSVTIRLSRFGKKKAPSYRVVVSNTRDKRDGKYIEKIGVYNPSETPAVFEFDKKKFEEWKGKGALVTKAVERLLDGTYEYIPYAPDKDKKKTTENASSEEQPAAEPEKETIEEAETPQE